MKNKFALLAAALLGLAGYSSVQATPFLDTGIVQDNWYADLYLSPVDNGTENVEIKIDGITLINATRYPVAFHGLIPEDTTGFFHFLAEGTHNTSMVMAGIEYPGIPYTVAATVGPRPKPSSTPDSGATLGLTSVGLAFMSLARKVILT